MPNPTAEQLKEELKVEVLVELKWLKDKGDVAEAYVLGKLREINAAQGRLLDWLLRYDADQENPRHQRAVDSVKALAPVPARTKEMASTL